MTLYDCLLLQSNQANGVGGNTLLSPLSGLIYLLVLREASLLISETPGNYVGPNTTPFMFKAKGHIMLKGKEAPVALLAVEQH